MAANSVEIDKKIFLLNTDEKTHNLKQCYRNYKSKMDYHTRDFNIYKMKQNDIYSTKEISYFGPS